jgi:hypothetical protein
VGRDAPAQRLRRALDSVLLEARALPLDGHVLEVLVARCLDDQRVAELAAFHDRRWRRRRDDRVVLGTGDGFVDADPDEHLRRLDVEHLAARVADGPHLGAAVWADAQLGRHGVGHLDALELGRQWGRPPARTRAALRLRLAIGSLSTSRIRNASPSGSKSCRSSHSSRSERGRLRRRLEICLVRSALMLHMRPISATIAVTSSTKRKAVYGAGRQLAVRRQGEAEAPRFQPLRPHGDPISVPVDVSNQHHQAVGTLATIDGLRGHEQTHARRQAQHSPAPSSASTSWRSAPASIDSGTKPCFRKCSRSRSLNSLARLGPSAALGFLPGRESTLDRLSAICAEFSRDYAT